MGEDPGHHFRAIPCGRWDPLCPRNCCSSRIRRAGRPFRLGPSFDGTGGRITSELACDRLAVSDRFRQSGSRMARPAHSARIEPCPLFFLIKPLALEFFIMPTNSSAPTLIGYHKSAPCPNCGGSMARNSILLRRLRSSQSGRPSRWRTPGVRPSDPPNSVPMSSLWWEILRSGLAIPAIGKEPQAIPRTPFPALISWGWALPSIGPLPDGGFSVEWSERWRKCASGYCGRRRRSTRPAFRMPWWVGMPWPYGWRSRFFSLLANVGHDSARLGAEKPFQLWRNQRTGNHNTAAVGEL
jgi:hypothetical protein